MPIGRAYPPHLQKVEGEDSASWVGRIYFYSAGADSRMWKGTQLDLLRRLKDVVEANPEMDKILRHCAEWNVHPQAGVNDTNCEFHTQFDGFVPKGKIILTDFYNR